LTKSLDTLSGVALYHIVFSREALYIFYCLFPPERGGRRGGTKGTIRLVVLIVCKQVSAARNTGIALFNGISGCIAAEAPS
jgi:hypothetical protein